MNNHTLLDKYKKLLDERSFVRHMGRVTKVVGLTIESEGPETHVGALCTIRSRGNKHIMAEVVGFRDNSVLLMPIGDMSGIGPGSTVTVYHKDLEVGMGESLLGRVLNGLGHPMDGKGPIVPECYYPVSNRPPNPMARPRIRQVLPLGVKCIDGLLTVGKGQRIGIFAGSGVGKSTLLGMIARNTKADINVIALIGERGREVREFLERDLQEEGLKRSVVVIATSDQPALIRLKGAMVATAIAEYFRDKGKDVLFLMDSLTRFSMAQREIGLAIGEPPVSRGYTPSVFAILPKLLERAGTSEKGSITGLYSVLVDGDDMTEPITDTARGILDGHIALSRQLAHRNHYPAIDVLGSVSRVMTDIVEEDHLEYANELRRALAIYRDADDLINVGAYVKGSNPAIDWAISLHDTINEFLVQGVFERYTFHETIEKLKQAVTPKESA
ncbi:MAG: flagellar protein export ATPase FliI [Clostridiaceae bacterium]|jgi:flagellum-specific ATP synthase|nr:flagellar protein export ATPase FliI [Clostridiaceae bacterium]